MIPLAYLPQLADAASWLSLSFGSASLLLLLGLDAWRSKSKKTHWIPCNSLVLGALSLQLLGLICRPLVNISDSQKLDSESLTQKEDEILQNMLTVLSGRAAMCVFMGNMVADVARSRDRNVWSDMLALSISATGLLIHLSYEIYIITIGWISDDNYWEADIVLYLTTHIILFASIVLLLLLLNCAVFASKSIHKIVAQRIPVLLYESENRNPKSLVCWEAVEEHVVRSWITARTHQPQYIIARSVLISSIAFLVTTCVGLCLGFYILQLANDISFIVPLGGGLIDWLTAVAVVVQWIFILMGWAMICWRWLTSVVFYPRRMGSVTLTLKLFFSVEDFWTRATLELQEELKEKDVGSINSSSFLNKFVLMFLQKFWVYKLLSVLFYLQILLVLMSKTCWLISEMVFSNLYMRRILMGAVSKEFSVLYNFNNNGGLVELTKHREFVKYLDNLMYMRGENPAGVWIANQKMVEKMKARISQGESDGKDCKALISLLEKTTMQRSTDPHRFSQRKLQIQKDFNREKSSAKITAVSLVSIIIELSAFYQQCDGVSVGYAGETVEECIKGCSEAWEIMSLFENEDPEAAVVNKQADQIFQSLKKWHKWLDRPLPINKFEVRTIENAKEALQGLADLGKEKANGGCITNNGYDSKDWKAVNAGNNLYNVCESIKSRSDSIEELLDVIESLLADVIGSCMIKVEEIIVDQCNLWTKALMEEKLWDLSYEAWKAKGVIQQLRPGTKFTWSSRCQFKKMHSF